MSNLPLEIIFKNIFAIIKKACKRKLGICFDFIPSKNPNKFRGTAANLVGSAAFLFRCTARLGLPSISLSITLGKMTVAVKKRRGIS